MKEHTKGIFAGALAATLFIGIGTTALAATGQLTITVDPINIQVNGETFQPKDAQGADVPVFAYNGTTYAPLRALAEAYGLEVGYDAQTNMATVGAKAGNDVQPTTTPTPDTTVAAADYSDWTAEEEAAYQEFKGMWEWKMDGYQDMQNASVFCGRDGKEGIIELKKFLSSHTAKAIDIYSIRLTKEINQQNPGTNTVFRTGPNGVGTWLWTCSELSSNWVSNYEDYIEDIDAKLGKSGV